MMKKLNIKICKSKSTIVENIILKKEKRLFILPKVFPKYSLSSKTDSKTKFKLSFSKKLLSKNCKPNKKNKKWKSLNFCKKLYKRFKKIFGRKRYNKKKLKLPVACAHRFFYFKLTILIKKNNIFCNFSDFKNNKTLNSCSSGKYKIKVSKKTLKYTYDIVLNRFISNIWRKVYAKIKKKEKKTKQIKKIVPRKGLFVNVVCSTRLRKKVCQYVHRKFKKIPLIINAVSKKVFNGCRPPKKVRKKRRRMRIYK